MTVGTTYATAQKEQFSMAYVHAIASAVGFTLAHYDVDDDSIDVTIKAKGNVGQYYSPRLDLQLKCTQNLQERDEANWKFQVPRKNYEELIPGNVHVPRLLVVMKVPATVSDWVIHDAHSLTIHHCAYYVSLKGLADLPAGQESKTIDIPKANEFSVAGLREIVRRIGDKEPL